MCYLPFCFGEKKQIDTKVLRLKHCECMTEYYTADLYSTGQAELPYAGGSLSSLAEAEHPSPNSDNFLNIS